MKGVSEDAAARVGRSRPVSRTVEKAYTLVELLVVVAIIGIVLALLLPAIQTAREAARRTQCANHLRQLGWAIQQYHDVFQAFPMGSTMPRDPLRFGLGWQVFALPFMEHGSLYDSIDPGYGPSGRSQQARLTFVTEFTCPSHAAGEAASGPVPLPATNYSAVAGAGKNGQLILTQDERTCGNSFTDGVLFLESCTRMADVVDGSVHTLLLGERRYQLSNWLQGAYWIGSPAQQTCVPVSKNARWPINASHAHYGYYVFDRDAPEGAEKSLLYNDLFFGSQHPQGAQFAYVDGHVGFLAEGLELLLFQALATRNGEELREP